ncbi:MAG: gamma-glutamylcyclotransferase [Alphaproteobacteria bacterium]|uniref:gamma-glutamylcyclotransferase n=1 Tax=Pyruvatibacter sp. HU-CL02332 TaxID=3127650 RepID=UPI002967F293|nr:gamma-glutamylcyclotransferase [Alphaproteobacteria bacterium]
MDDNFQDLWVFGYGSLMWRPGFEYLERHQARIAGYHRAFCVYSHHHRGTPEKPGLVLGLTRGGACRGMLYRVAAANADDTVAYLREREQVTAVYREVRVNAVKLDDKSRHSNVLTYVAEPGHEQYAGRLDAPTQAQLIAYGEGKSGRNPEYLASMVEHLREMGIRDSGLEALLLDVEAKLAAD